MLGLGQRGAEFSSPDFPMGAADFQAMAGIDEQSDFVGGPGVGAPQGAPEPQLAGVAGEANFGGSETPAGGTQQHWSNLFSTDGPLLFMLIITILYLGLLSVRLGARIRVS